jgi:hypothetical protein
MTSTSIAAESPPAGQKRQTAATVRFLMLLGILAAVSGGYAYDYFVAAPDSERAYLKLQALVDLRNAQPAKSGQPLRAADVQQVIGFAPTFTQVETDHTIQWYCWWGRIPGLNTWKRYVTVVYVGHEPRRYGSHYLNEAPPEESLPKNYLPTEIAHPLPTPGPLGLPGSGSPPDDAKAGSLEQDESEFKNKSRGTGKLNAPAGEPTQASP